MALDHFYKLIALSASSPYCTHGILYYAFTSDKSFSDYSVNDMCTFVLVDTAFHSEIKL